MNRKRKSLQEKLEKKIGAMKQSDRIEFGIYHRASITYILILAPAAGIIAMISALTVTFGRFLTFLGSPGLHTIGTYSILYGVSGIVVSFLLLVMAVVLYKKDLESVDKFIKKRSNKK